MSIIPTLSMKAERKWFMSSYAFKLASERPWEALVGPTEGDPINQDKVDMHYGRFTHLSVGSCVPGPLLSGE